MTPIGPHLLSVVEPPPPVGGGPGVYICLHDTVTQKLATEYIDGVYQQTLATLTLGGTQDGAVKKPGFNLVAWKSATFVHRTWFIDTNQSFFINRTGARVGGFAISRPVLANNRVYWVEETNAGMWLMSDSENFTDLIEHTTNPTVPPAADGIILLSPIYDGTLMKVPHNGFDVNNGRLEISTAIAFFVDPGFLPGDVFGWGGISTGIPDGAGGSLLWHPGAFQPSSFNGSPVVVTGGGTTTLWPDAWGVNFGEWVSRNDAGTEIVVFGDSPRRLLRTPIGVQTGSPPAEIPFANEPGGSRPDFIFATN